MTGPICVHCGEKIRPMWARWEHFDEGGSWYVCWIDIPRYAEPEWGQVIL